MKWLLSNNCGLPEVNTIREVFSFLKISKVAESRHLNKRSDIFFQINALWAAQHIDPIKTSHMKGGSASRER